MTAILFDGFDHGDMEHRWTINTAAGFDPTSPRTGTHRANISTAGELYLALDSTQEDDVIYVGFGFNRYTDIGIGFGPMVILDLSENFAAVPHLSLVMHPGIRGWGIWRGSGVTYGTGTELVSLEPNIWFPESWHHVEFGCKIHDTTGWAELRQDGVTILRFDGDTRNGGTDGLIDEVRFNVRPGGPLFAIDDVSIINEQGSVNNTWLGDTRCYPLYPNGNGTSSTPLSGSDGNSTDNYLLVDEVGTPDTSDYVFSATAGDQDTYTFEDLPVSVGTIRGVEVRAHAAKDDTGTKQIRMITRRSSTDSFGPDHVLAAEPLYQTHHDLDELDPHAGPGAWTITNVNSTEWGVEVRS